MAKTTGSGKNLTLFDARPMVVGSFEFTAHGATAVGSPSVRDWQEAYIFATNAQESSPYWVSDLLEYAHARDEWKPVLDQILASTGLALQTIYNRHSVGSRVSKKARTVAQSFTHVAKVVKLDEDEQVEWLTKSRDENWTTRELELNVRASKRRKVIEGQAVLEGQYRVIYADPPWLYGNKPPSGSGAQSHYSGMTIKQLCDLAVAAHTRPDAVLFMWVPAPMLFENPGPREVIEAWQFRPKTGLVWDKVNHNFGNYVSVRHEHLIIATRGKCLPDRPTPMFDSVLTERQDGVHSSKPASARTMIQRLYDGPYIELFAREKVEGWSTFGDDAALWTRSA